MNSDNFKPIKKILPKSVSCDIGCDQDTRSAELSCTAKKVIKVTLGYNFSQNYIYMKLTVCVAGVSDFVSELEKIGPIKDLLAKNGIEGGCLFIGEGRLHPQVGMVTLKVKLSLWSMVANIFGEVDAQGVLVYDHNAGTRDQRRHKECISWLFYGASHSMGVVASLNKYTECMAPGNGVGGVYNKPMTVGAAAWIAVVAKWGVHKNTIWSTWVSFVE